MLENTAQNENMAKLESRRFILSQIAYNTPVTTNTQAKFQWIYSYEMILNSNFNPALDFSLS